MPPRKRQRESYAVQQHRWKLSLLRAFVTRNGWDDLKRDTVVPPGVKLYRWVTARRIDYKADKIAAWLVTECEAIPGWSWSVFYDAHRRNLDNLRRFVKKHGWDAITGKPIVDDVRLDKWVAHRRDEYKRGDLDAWLARGLEAIPGWTWDPRRAGYERNLNILREQVALYGWPSIHERTVSRRGTNIGHWVSNVRAMYRRGDLEPWVAEELERISGWTWEPRRSRQQENVQRLASFVETRGWDAVSDGLVVDNVKLGDWISNCRVRYRNGSLSKDTITGLEAIPGWSWSGRTSWYQPKDDAGRFVQVSDRERLRNRESRTTRVGDRFGPTQRAR